MSNNSKILRSPRLRECWFSLWFAFQYLGSTNECFKSKSISNINDVSTCLLFNVKQHIELFSWFWFLNRFCSLTGISRRPLSGINILRVLSSLPACIPATQWATAMDELGEIPFRNWFIYKHLLHPLVQHFFAFYVFIGTGCQKRHITSHFLYIAPLQRLHV